MNALKIKRPARLVVAYRPRLDRVVVLHKGRVVCRSLDHAGAEAFIKGWREAEAPTPAIQAEVENFTAAELPAACNAEAIRSYVNYMVSEIGILRARTLDDAALILGRLCASQNMYVYRGGNHLAVHMFSGHPTRLLIVKEA